MEQYIKKSVLVAEIKRILSAFENSDAPVDRLRASTLIGLSSFIDTLEVKEVNLEKEVDEILEENDWDHDKINFYDFAGHFFELGLRVQKGK